MTRKTSRRRFLTATAAVGAAASLNVAVLAQDEGDGDGGVILLGGNTPGWEAYRLPGDATAEEAETNPTLTLQAGTTYTLIWQNVDGQPHNFAIYDSDGENLQVLQPLDVDEEQYNQLNETGEDETVAVDEVLGGNETDGEQTTVPEEDLAESTDNLGEQGAVQGVRFEASEEMAQYICEVHPNTMVGDIELADGGDGGEENNSSS